MNLKQKALKGFFWSCLGSLGYGSVNFVVTIILARILTPQDFALIALLTVFVLVSNVIVDSGFTQAIIRDDNPTETDLSSVFILNLFLSLLFYTILYFSAPLISSFYELEELVLISRIVFLVIIFNGLIIIQNAVLKRDLSFAVVERASVIGSFMSGSFAILMAFFQMGIWSLVANIVLMPFFRGVILWSSSSWRPKMLFSFNSINKYWSFGVFLMFQGLIDVIITNLNTILIGKVYTKSDLGYYSQGGKLDSYLVTPLNVVLDKVIYPVLSKLKNDDFKLKDAYRQVLSLVLFVMLPILLFISLNANDIIIFFFGDKWYEAGKYLQLLSILGLFQLIHKVFTNLVMIKGKTKIMFLLSIIKQSLRLLTLLFTLNISVYAMAVGFVISGIIGSLLYIGLGMYYIKYYIFEFLQDNYRTFISTLLAIFLSYCIRDIICLDTVVLNLLIQCLSVLVLYILFSLILKNKCIPEFYNVLIILVRK